MVAQKTESQCRFGRRPRFGDHHDAVDLIFKEGDEFGEVIFNKVLTGKNNGGKSGPGFQPFETASESLDHGFCPQVRSADANHHHGVDFACQVFGRPLDIDKLLFSDGRGEIQPAEKIAAFTISFMKFLLLGHHFIFQVIDLILLNEFIDPADV